MKLLGIEIIFPARRIRIERGERLSEEEILAALAAGEKNRHWLAFLQVLDDYIEGADLNIGADPGNAGLVTWNAGGSEYLKNFRKHLLTKRAEAVRDFKADPGKLKRALARSGIKDASGAAPAEEFAR